MSTGVLELARPKLKLNTKKTENYLMKYAGQPSRRHTSKDKVPRLHNRRSSVVSADKLGPSTLTRRTASLIPQKFMEPSQGLSLPRSGFKPKFEHRELSQAFKEAILKPLAGSRRHLKPKSMQRKQKLAGFELMSSKTTRTSNQSTKPEDSLLSLLEALDRAFL
jgi:hypothetical protein